MPHPLTIAWYGQHFLFPVIFWTYFLSIIIPVLLTWVGILGLPLSLFCFSPFLFLVLDHCNHRLLPLASLLCSSVQIPPFLHLFNNNMVSISCRLRFIIFEHYFKWFRVHSRVLNVAAVVPQSALWGLLVSTVILVWQIL